MEVQFFKKFPFEFYYHKRLNKKQQTAAWIKKIDKCEKTASKRGLYIEDKITIRTLKEDYI